MYPCGTLYVRTRDPQRRKFLWRHDSKGRAVGAAARETVMQAVVQASASSEILLCGALHVVTKDTAR
jgi:hypothetical protein